MGSACGSRQTEVEDADVVVVPHESTPVVQTDTSAESEDKTKTPELETQTVILPTAKQTAEEESSDTQEEEEEVSTSVISSSSSESSEFNPQLHLKSNNVQSRIDTCKAAQECALEISPDLPESSKDTEPSRTPVWNTPPMDTDTSDTDASVLDKLPPSQPSKRTVGDMTFADIGWAGRQH